MAQKLTWEQKKQLLDRLVTLAVAASRCREQLAVQVIEPFRAMKDELDPLDREGHWMGSGENVDLHIAAVRLLLGPAVENVEQFVNSEAMKKLALLAREQVGVAT